MTESSIPAPDPLLTEGLDAKAGGNDAFKAGEYRKAIVQYTAAIDSFEDFRDGPGVRLAEACSLASESTNDGSSSPENKENKEGSGNGQQDGAKRGQEEATPAEKELYQKLVRDLAVCYSNRAFCQIKLENFGSAIIAGEMGTEVDPTYSKSYYRVGCARYALGKYKDALKAFKALCKLAPQDKDARLKLKECEKMVLNFFFFQSVGGCGPPNRRL